MHLAAEAACEAHADGGPTVKEWMLGRRQELVYGWQMAMKNGESAVVLEWMYGSQLEANPFESLTSRVTLKGGAQKPFILKLHDHRHTTADMNSYHFAATDKPLSEQSRTAFLSAVEISSSIRAMPRPFSVSRNVACSEGVGVE